MAKMKFFQLTLGAEFTLTFRVMATGPNAVLNIIDMEGEVVGTTTINLANGSTSGNIPDRSVVDVNCIAQHFEPGDLICNVDGSTAIMAVYGMTNPASATDLILGGHQTQAGVSPRAWISVPSGDFVRVGHADPSTFPTCEVNYGA